MREVGKYDSEEDENSQVATKQCTKERQGSQRKVKLAFISREEQVTPLFVQENFLQSRKG